MNLGIIQIASIISIFQCILLTLFLLSRKKGTINGEKYLAAFLFTFAVLIYSSFVLSTKLSINPFHATCATVATQFNFLVGPLCYFYIRSLLSGDTLLKKVELLHFIPFMGMLISAIIIIRSSGIRSYYQTLPFYFNGGICLHILFYILISMKTMRAHGLRIGRFLNSTKTIKHNWIIFLFGGLVTIWVFKMVILWGWYVTHVIRWCQYMTTSFFLTTFIFINTIVYIALKRPELFSHKNKYDQSSLSVSKKQLYLNRLKNHMESKKPHLQPSITLPELAQTLSIPRHHLSQVINESFNLNFNDFINKYRIDEALGMLQERSHHNGTILEIAFQVGFNSKSTFNSAFKKHTGQTPKEYKNNEIGLYAVLHDRQGV